MIRFRYGNLKCWFRTGILFFILPLFLFGTDSKTVADCSGSILFHQGTQFVVKHYTVSGGDTNMLQFTIDSVRSVSGNYFSYSSMRLIQDTIIRFVANVENRCNGQLILTGWTQVLIVLASANGQQIEGHFPAYPLNADTGLKLPDADMLVKFKKRKSMVFAFSLSNTNRRVEGIEEIKTNAGTFTCYKISSVLLTKTNLLSTSSRHSKLIEWFSPVAGIVRSENRIDEKISEWYEIDSIKE